MQRLPSLTSRGRRARPARRRVLPREGWRRWDQAPLPANWVAPKAPSKATGETSCPVAWTVPSSIAAIVSWYSAGQQESLGELPR